MEATPPPASPDPPSAAPPAFAPAAPAAVSDRLRVPLAFAVGALAMILAVAGYRLYEKDRAETAAELVRIRAYLEVRAQADAAPAKMREKPKAPTPPAASLAAARVEAKTRPPVEPVERTAPKPRPAKPAVEPRRAKARPAVEPRPKPVTDKPHAPAAPPAERPKNVDRLWTERVARECSPGFLGLICREWLKFELCREHQAWGKASVCPAAEQPPPAVVSGSLG